jgi:hypothetical protein
MSEGGSKKSGQNQRPPLRLLKHKDWQQYSLLGLILVIWLSTLIPIVLTAFTTPDKLVIVASMGKEDTTHYVEGRVLYDGGPAESFRIWAILCDTEGNSYSPEGDSTNAQGEFRVLLDPAALPRTVTSLTVHVRGQLSEGSKVIEGEKRCFGGFRSVIDVDIGSFAILPIFFVTCFLVPFLPLSFRWKYFISITSSLLFAFGVMGLIGAGLYHVHSYYSPLHDTLAMGFGSVFHGSFVEGMAPEWIFSLSEKSYIQAESMSAEYLISSFGAPLWIVFLAVVGAAILTVSIIALEIKDRPNFILMESLLVEPGETAAANPKPGAQAELEDFRARLQRNIRHQFHILFSPIGAIFVYQSLLLTEAAGNLIAVAFAAFGAGAVVSLILDKAIRSAEKAVRFTSAQSSGDS